MRKALSRLTVVTYSRLHLTLLAMHQSEYRINGGIGFAIKAPSNKLVFTRSTNFEIEDQRSRPMSLAEQERLLNILKVEGSNNKFDTSFRIDIVGDMFTHSGFGSGTAITLASIEALHLLNGRTINKESLIKASGRGGTSGVGINTYFNGGCIFDLGRQIDDVKHRPSSMVESKPMPFLLDQFAMPNWTIGICIPKSIPNKSQLEEQGFFERVCPIPATSVYEATYHTLFGVYAALKEKNKSSFCKALKNIQQCTWKKSERKEYGQALVDIEDSLYKCGADAVGMSSLGPCLFFLADNVDEVISEMKKLSMECEMFVTHPHNQGRLVNHD